MRKLLSDNVGSKSLLTLDTRMTWLQTTALLSYDFTDMKVAADITTMVDGMTSRNKTIIDYNKKMIYNYNEMTGDCTVSPFDQPFRKACVPDDAKQLGNFYYGAGDNMLQATSYMLNRNGLTYYVYFTTAGCIPITEVAVGNMGPTATMIATGFENITPGIKNSSVFSPPPACQQAKVQHFQKSERRGLLGLHL
ncbi:ependymin-related protein 1-like [Haliotis cracherodii]|uniref:ependymin-related protein 1-like n=1 Tax=Haliotis cracherodii TaxID=6455 RepID=UPI0039EC0EE0